MKVVSKLRRYGLATIVCGVALAVASPLDAPSSCFFLAVIVSSLYGGKGPALLSVGLSALAFYYFFLPPLFQLSAKPSSYLRFAIFLGATLLIAGLMEAKQRIEESRRKIDAQYRTVSDTAPDAIISIERNSRILFTNPAATPIFRWDASEMIGQPLTILLPEFGVAERLSRGELTGRRKDGTEFTAEVSLGAVAGGDQKTFTGFVRDITERKRVEERLREYEKLVEGSQDMIAVVDRQHRYLIANRAFLSYRGMNRQQVVGHTISEVLDKDVLQTVKTQLKECFHGKVVKYELRYKYPRLGFRNLLLSYFPIEGSNGIDRVACILEDITERKEAEAALRTLSGRLLRMEDEERRRLARELHDSTAQLLAALSMNLAVVNESAEVLMPRTQGALAESVTLADQCLREIRTVSYLLHPPDLDELGLQFALPRYVHGFGQRSGINVELKVSPDLGRLPQEVETTIFRVVQESLTNIHRHSGSGTASICLIRGPAEIILEVKDGGQGIPADAPPGVGIASMRERVQQLGGRLEVGSDQTGAAVKAFIPLSKAAL